MQDHLSISNLLGLLQIDRQNNIIRLCEQAERLRRRRHYVEAIKVAQNAVFLSKNDYVIMGAPLLYLCSARLCSGQPDQEQLAIQECDRAIRAWSYERFNRAIGELIRARIKTQYHSDDYILIFRSVRSGLSMVKMGQVCERRRPGCRQPLLLFSQRSACK